MKARGRSAFGVFLCHFFKEYDGSRKGFPRKQRENQKRENPQNHELRRHRCN
jgi:hypothetical protein